MKFACKIIKMNWVIISLLLMYTSVGTLQAQGSVDLRIEKGKILGLPQKYHPASFNSEDLTFSAGGQKIVFPKILQQMLRHNPEENPFNDGELGNKVKPHEYSFWAQLKPANGLPPYLVITITPAKKVGKSQYVQLFIGLDNLNLISAYLCTSDWGEVPIDTKK